MDKIIQCDVTQGIPLADKSVHCVITSPPYWGLRDYGVEGQLGLEKTPEQFIKRMVKVFREVWRVLRDDGTLWLNMGDSYTSGGRGGGQKGPAGEKQRSNQGALLGPKKSPSGLKNKELCMMPHRLAMALQKDGWWIRSDIVWHKPNPMPESVTDRPTKSHEYIFLCTKRAKYYYDADAIKEECKDPEDDLRRLKQSGTGTCEHKKHTGTEKSVSSFESWSTKDPQLNLSGRNKRSVWTIPTQSYSEAHFATFPEKLVEPCIKAGTSEKGCCAECGAPWVRIVEKDRQPTRAGLSQKTEDYNYDTQRHVTTSTTTGWKPTCKHYGTLTKATEKIALPCTVFDLFMGSGTVGLVAYKLNRHYVGTELSQEYIDMAERRIQKEKDKYGLIE